ncbi:MAG TPA: enoyl-CoA hydratase/isomerase family protein [Dehalococcoidia bacterium]
MAVRYERLDAVALITLDRPQALNAINEDLSRELREAWERFMAEEDALVAVLTGEGRAFCAGLDMKEAAEAVRNGRELRLTPQLDPRQITKPTIAAVNGPAAGGGVAFVLGCDIAICADTAVFTLPFAARGRGGAHVVLQLAQRTSYNAALYMGLTGQRIDAHTALRIGLVQEVLPPDDLLPRALELAEKIAGFSQPSVRTIKANLVHALEVGYAEALARMQGWDSGLPQEDVKEGTLAFDEKRRPRYRQP